MVVYTIVIQLLMKFIWDIPNYTSYLHSLIYVTLYMQQYVSLKYPHEK